jgi:multidrug resistance efflux pump
MAKTTETEVLEPQARIQQRVLLEQVSDDGKNPQEQTHKTKTPRSKLSRRSLIVLSALLVAAVAATAWWLYPRKYESTDDAQIDGHVDLVGSRISGTVTYINPQVENNQFVEAGTLLLEFDPRDYQAELEHAKANLDTSIAEAHSASVNNKDRSVVADRSDHDQYTSCRARERALNAAILRRTLPRISSNISISSMLSMRMTLR